MMKKLTYTYKGRPIDQRGRPGRASAWNNSRRKNSGMVFFVYSLCVLILASVLVWIFFLVKQLNEKQDKASTEEKTAEQQPSAIQQPEKRTALVPARTTVAQKKDTGAPQQKTAVTQNDFRVYNAGLRAYNGKNYVNARNAMRLLLDKIAIQPGHPLYNKACQILGDSNMKLYHQGADPSEWGEYTVRRGDILSRIAARNSTTVKDLMEVNQLTNHNLRIGQKLRIPRSAWRMRIECGKQRLLLYSNGRLFKIYPLELADKAKEVESGIYRIRSKQINPTWKQGNRILRGGITENPLGSRIMVLTGETGNAAGKRTALHGRTRTTERSNVWFSMTEPEIQELYKLTPSNTEVEITK